MDANPQYLLDTCTWIEAFSAPERLKPSIRKLLLSQRLVSLASISLLEVARKESMGELIFDMPITDWYHRALPPVRIKVIDISAEISIDATRLPAWEHKDPADRLIVATARSHRLTILTSDEKILQYPHVKSLASRR